MDVSPEVIFSKHSLPASSGGFSSLLTLLEKVPSLLWTTDRELRFTTVAGAELLNEDRPSETFLGQCIDSMFCGSNRELMERHRMALHGEAAGFDLEANGRILTGRVEPLHGSDGQVIGTVGIALDDTVRLVAERAINLSEQNFRSLIDEMPLAVCRATKTGQLLQVNRAMLEMLGYDEESEGALLIRDLPRDIFADPIGFDDFLNRLMDEKAFHGFESTWMCRSGQKIDVRVGGRVVHDKTGDTWYLDVLAENVTERKQLQEQWNQAQKMHAIGQLAGGVAHDFNNLLTVIQGQVELLLGEGLESSVHRRLEEVMRASERASSLTQQLLAFSRRQVLQSKVLDLNQVIGQMIQLLSRLITENIRLTFIPSPVPAYVRADSSQVVQVMMNLAVNARDAMPQGGQLIIKISNVLFSSEAATRQGANATEYALISVRDTGLGMDSETKSRIFEPFFTTKRPGSGTGLGLSLVYGVVQQSGGEIRVKSEVGQGTVFNIYLPGVGEPGPSLAESATAVLPKGRETILYAEDEVKVRELVSFYLTSLGYRVLSAADGLLAKQLADSHKGNIDLLLSDVMMPNMSGLELGNEMRKKIPGLKIVFVSGYAGKDFELENAHFLPKPFSMQVLAKKVREALDDGTS